MAVCTPAVGSALASAWLSAASTPSGYSEYTCLPAASAWVIPRSAADLVVRPVMAVFLLRYPDIRLDIVSDDRLVNIVADGFDAGIREGRLLAQDMISVPLGPSLRFAVVGSPGYFAQRPEPSTPQDLLGHSCIRRRFPNGTPYP